MAKVKQNYDSSRSFLLLTYKLYHKLDTLSGTNKAYCLTVFLSLLKYAWKSSGYKCSIRYTTLIKDTKLARFTKVMPREYKRVLLAQERAKKDGTDPMQAVMEVARG